MDFTDLNKACPKDSFPLPKIDQLVDSTAGHALLSFMDANSGYNLIPVYEPDQEHTSFITDRGLYYYIGMPFGLLNAGATYQRLVNKMFEKQIGKMMDVYVDHILRCLWLLGKRNSNVRGGIRLTPSLLCEQADGKRRNAVHRYGKAILCPCLGLPEVEAVFPGS